MIHPAGPARFDREIGPADLTVTGLAKALPYSWINSGL
jgi:hypothetical protein